MVLCDRLESTVDDFNRSECRKRQSNSYIAIRWNSSQVIIDLSRTKASCFGSIFFQSEFCGVLFAVSSWGFLSAFGLSFLWPVYLEALESLQNFFFKVFFGAYILWRSLGSLALCSELWLKTPCPCTWKVATNFFIKKWLSMEIGRNFFF